MESHIFRNYDIRGIYGKDIDEKIMERIGFSFGKFIKSNIVCGRDMRKSSASLEKSFIKGFNMSGFDVYDIGQVPIGLAVFAGAIKNLPSAFITASHLPKEYNGIKFFHKNGTVLDENDGKEIKNIFYSDVAENKNGTVKKEDINNLHNEYRELLHEIKPIRKIKIATDFGNGMIAHFMPFIKELGYDYIPIFEKIDGNFPNRLSEPNIDNLTKLKEEVVNCDIGFAFDGDGDRLVVVDEKGNKLSSEQTSYLILSELLKIQKGDIVANVECSRSIDDIARKFGRNIIRVPVGYTFIVQEVIKNNAAFGVEFSGHYAIPGVSITGDAFLIAMYAAFSLSKRREKLSDITKEIKKYHFKMTNIEFSDDKAKFAAMEKIKEEITKSYTNISFVDGVRIEKENGWALIRPSNTSPIIRLTTEGNDEKSLNDLKNEFLKIIEKFI